MTYEARKDGQADRVVAISEALLSCFGERAQEVAQRQTELAVDGVAQTWLEIVAHIAMRSPPPNAKQS